MNEQLIIRLGSDISQPVFWIVWSIIENDIIASGELSDAGSLASLQERAGNRQVICLVPTRDVSLKQVTLPARASRKALSAIPFMLEEELSQDIDELFFPLGPRSGQLQCVAVVAKSKMDNWLAMLRDAGLQTRVMIPDALAIPHHDDGFSLLALGNSLLVRENQWKAMEGEQSWIQGALTFAAKKQPEPLTVHCYSPAEQFASADITLNMQTLDAPLQVLAQHYPQAGINLLQGEYKQTQKKTGQWHKWRLAAGLAIVALIATMSEKVIQLQSLNNQQAQLESAITEQFKSVFPNSRRIGDVRQIRSRINNELQRLQQGGGDIALLAMLSRLTDAFAQSDVSPQLIRFDGDRGELRIQASGRNFGSLERFKAAVESAGFVVDQGAINNRDNNVISAMTIRS